MKEITFYSRFEKDILEHKKTITIRREGDVRVGDMIRVSKHEDGNFFCNIKILSVSPIHFSQLNETHAIQENMTLEQLKNVISEIYPGLLDLFLIEFILIDCEDKKNK
ncbi:hypothetical protein RB653_010041 [Dictyostelium firmibasis]|uniref:ASCH domain-containing protein n=1 Tax=Dictyostelium firmibasis TaxID=79012 RepID=A0AAN7U0F9_9MYCE